MDYLETRRNETSFSSTLIKGRLGKDPEYKTYGKNRLAKFSVATTAGKSTIWWNVTAWNDKAAEIEALELTKGDKVEMWGQVGHSDGYPRIWTGRDGLPRASFELNYHATVSPVTAMDRGFNELFDPEIRF